LQTRAAGGRGAGGTPTSAPWSPPSDAPGGSRGLLGALGGDGAPGARWAGSGGHPYAPGGIAQQQVADAAGVSQQRVSQITSPGTSNPERKRGAQIALSAGTSPEAGISRSRVSQITRGSPSKDSRDRGSRVQLNPGTSPEAAAARIRERLALVAAVERCLDAAAIEAHAGGG
jgi:hypothetical protein